MSGDKIFLQLSATGALGADGLQWILYRRSAGDAARGGADAEGHPRPGEP